MVSWFKVRGYRPGHKLISIGGHPEANADAAGPVVAPMPAEHARDGGVAPAAGSQREKVCPAIAVVAVVAKLVGTGGTHAGRVGDAAARAQVVGATGSAAEDLAAAVTEISQPVALVHGKKPLMAS